MKLWMLVSVIAALFLTGCGTPVPDSDAQDWCYVFEFTTGQQGFLITSGSLTAQGITSDGTGLLQTSYGYNRDVYPNFVIVTVVRPTGVTGDIEATAAGTAFGIQTYFTATMPADVNSAPLVFSPPTTGEEIIGDRNAINITVDGSQPIAIASIDIRGMGASPFPSNPCDDSTPTPGTPTGTPSGTPTVTATASATATGTLSATPTSLPVCEWDMTTIGGGSIVSTPGWTYYPGFGYGLGASNPTISAGFVVDGTISRITLTFNQSYSGKVRLMTYGGTLSSNPVGSGSVWDYTGLSITSGFSVQVTNSSGGGVDAALRLTHVRVEGTGCASPTSTPTPTGTPGPTNTPAATNTQEPLWSGCTDFTASSYSFIGINADYEDERGFIQEGPEWSVGRTGMDTGKKRKLKIKFGAGQTFSGQIRLSDNGSNATSWLTVAGNTVFVEYSAASWTPTTSFFVEFDGNDDELILEQICYIDPAPSTGTPAPGTITPVGTRTPLPTMTSAPLPSRTPLQVPVPIIYITSTAGVVIIASPIYGGTGVYSATGTTSPLITGTPGTEGTPDGTGFGSGGGGFGDVGDMVGFSWNIGWGLLGALIAYLGQATNIVTGLLTAFANATPQAIPGLPMCITNPMAHDLCALWYIIDNTIFAPATPGQYIVPLLQIIFNVVIAIIFVRWVMKIIWRGESVTHVE